MDPVINLERQRELAAELIDVLAGSRPVDNVSIRWKAEELAELVLSLDDWRMKGGFDPYIPAVEFPVGAESYYGQSFEEER